MAVVGFGANVSSFTIAKGDETQKLDVDIVVIPRVKRYGSTMVERP